MAFCSARFTKSSFALLGCALFASALSAQGRPATFKGRVLMDTLIRPIPGAEILLPDLAKAAIADEKGTFRIDSIVPGIHRVLVRRVGYGLFDAKIRFDEDQTVERGILLPRLTNIDAVVIVGESFLPMSVLEHRAAGLGRFVGRAELEKQGNRRLSDILYQVQGLGVMSGRGGQGWPMSKRYQPPVRFAGLGPPDPCTRGNGMPNPNQPGEDMYNPDCFQKNSGMKAGCFARVYLDNVLLNPESPAEPVNIRVCDASHRGNRVLRERSDDADGILTAQLELRRTRAAPAEESVRIGPRARIIRDDRSQEDTPANAPRLSSASRASRRSRRYRRGANDVDQRVTQEWAESFRFIRRCR